MTEQKITHQIIYLPGIVSGLEPKDEFFSKRNLRFVYVPYVIEMCPINIDPISIPEEYLKEIKESLNPRG
ncbi:MAG: hypothetical protein KJ906_01995 [Nanoarchaeota archaeon]|nr:hypothetical protein [Nanoarchaeota archaeon]